jgi:hypothetical protein
MTTKSHLSDPVHRYACPGSPTPARDPGTAELFTIYAQVCSAANRLAIRGTTTASAVFVNARSEPMTRGGFAYVLKRHVETAARACPSLTAKQVSPHVLRHTCAMIVLQATQDIRKVSLWLGHANLATTEIYTRADPSEKLEAINAIVPPHLRKGRFRPPDKLIALLRDHSNGDQKRARAP